MKNAISVTFSLCAFFTCSAAYLTPEEALDRASRAEMTRHKAASPINQMSFAESRLAFTGEKGGCYVFNLQGDTGFAVLPSDDAYPPIVGFSSEGSFSPDKASPGMLALLRTFDAQVAAGVKPEKTPAQAGPDIEAIVKTKWDQGYPYNLLTPVIDGDHALTGCVATAMAQTFKTIGYPSEGEGTVEYKWTTGYETLDYDFTGKEFNYGLMLDEYTGASTEEERDAVAQLMLACGMAVKMDYSSTFSGAVDIDAALGLVSHFKFSRGLDLRYRDFYRIDEWTSMVYGELSQGRPILYYGFSPLGGHAFICDGYLYDNGFGYFHFNWGWSGVSDGYFLINLLNPEYIGNGAEATGFNREQSAIFGLEPATGTDVDPVEKVLCFGTFATGELEYKRSSSLLFGVASGVIRTGFFNMSIVHLEVTPGIKLIPTDGGSPLYVAATKTYSLQPGKSISTFSVRGGEMPASGEYVAVPVYKTGDGEWIDMPRTLFLKSRMVITCDEAGFKIDTTDDSDAVIVEEVTVGSDILYVGEPAEISVTCVSHNLSDEPTILVPVLINAKGEVSAQMAGKSVMEPDGETFQVTWSETFPDVAPGLYQLGILNEKFFLICDPLPVTVIDRNAETRIEISNLRINRKLADASNVVTLGDENVSVTFKATCVEGFFTGAFNVAILDKEGDVVNYLSDFQEKTIVPEESSDMSFKGSLGGLTPDETYSFAVYAEGESLSGIIGESYPFVAPMSGVQEISGDYPTAVYYDLQGIKVDNPTAGKPYIRVTKGRASKIVF